MNRSNIVPYPNYEPSSVSGQEDVAAAGISRTDETLVNRSSRNRNFESSDTDLNYFSCQLKNRTYYVTLKLSR